MEIALSVLDDGFLFLERFLASHVFKPNTPNLFEWIQEYKTGVKKVKTSKTEVHDRISIPENTLGGKYGY